MSLITIIASASLWALARHHLERAAGSTFAFGCVGAGVAIKL